MIPARKLRLKRLVAFSILMQNGKGIISKSPDYILDKLSTVNCLEEDLIQQILHPTLHHEYFEYLEEWKIHLEGNKEDESREKSREN